MGGNTRSRRIFPIALGLSVLLAGVVIVLVAGNTSDAASASTGGPEMALNVPGGNCDDPVRPTKCTVEGSFKLSVNALGVPAAGYILMQTFIDYGGKLIYTEQAVEDEIVWPDLDPGKAVDVEPGPGLIGHGGLTGSDPPPPISNHTGALVEILLTCPEAPSSQTTIDLLPYDDPVAATFGAAFVETLTGDPVIPKVGSLTINCIAATSTTTPTPTITTTRTLTPTPTPSPTPGLQPEMVLNVKSSPCDDPVRPTECFVGVGNTFELSVDALGVPANGYTLMQTFLDYGADLTYKQRTSVLDELIWPDVDPAVALRTEPGPGLLWHGGLTGLLPPPPASNYVGNVVEVDLTCPPFGTSQHVIDLLPEGDPVAGTEGAMFTEAVTEEKVVPTVGSLTIVCAFEPTDTPPPPTHTPTPKDPNGDTDADTIPNGTDPNDDNDGCTDDQENGPDETLGGLRDPHNPWDFYDVASFAEGPPDGIIDLPNDIFGVITHYAPTGNEPGYDVHFDRGPSTGPNVWDMTAPDGVIDLSNDILGVIQQYLHDCR